MLQKQRNIKSKSKSELINDDFINDLSELREKLPKTIKTLSIPVDYLSIRRSLIDWLSEIRLKLKLNHITTIKSSIIYDKVILTFHHQLNAFDHHLLMIASLLIAIKYEEIDQIHIESICSHIAHNKFTKKQILACEMMILKRLSFKLPNNDFIDFSHQVIGLLFDKCFTERDMSYRRLVEEFSILVYKLSLFDYELTKVDALRLYICVIFNSFKLFEMEPACGLEKIQYVIFEKLGICKEEIKPIYCSIKLLMKKFVVNKSKSFIIKEFICFINKCKLNNI
jgi:hypothetical protein